MSAKTTTQPGRRTPLSLTGAVSKGQSNRGGNSAASTNGNNANGHTTTNNNKQDNKQQQQKTEQQKSNNSDLKESSNNKKVQQQQQQSDKKQQQQQQNDNKKSNEKNHNLVNNSKQQQAYENKQNQQQNKESKQQNGNKLNENDKKEKTEKQQDKSERAEEANSKEQTKSESEIQENNKQDENKIKEVKEDKKEESTADETVNKVDENVQNELPEKKDDKKLKTEKAIEIADQKIEEEKAKENEISEEQSQLQQKSLPATPKANRTSKTPLNKTPPEKTPQKSTTLNSELKTTPTTRREVTTAIDDVEMEPLTVESSPIKSRQSQEGSNTNIAPSATSTPGKIVLPKRSSAVPKSDVQLAIQSGYSPERPRAFSQISGRRSIRPITDYTPSKFQSNTQFRESYRRINTELDVTNTSMNVTVGSEVPNNLSFSFFGRGGRKRDRTPPQHSQSAIGELYADIEASPPKKARFEGFLSAVSSPITLLRNRFSKATLQSSTPVKLEEKLNAAEDEIEVQNVSGVSIQEDLTNNENTPKKDAVLLDKETKEAKSNSAGEEDLEGKNVYSKTEIACGLEKDNEDSNIKIKETDLHVAVGDPLAKNKRCLVM